MTLQELHRQEQREAREAEAFRIFKESMAKLDADSERTMKQIERDTRMLQWIILISVLLVFLVGFARILLR